MTEVESSHVPMLSKPDVVIEVIRKAAKQSKRIRQPRRTNLILDRPSLDGLSFISGLYR